MPNHTFFIILWTAATALLAPGLPASELAIARPREAASFIDPLSIQIEATVSEDISSVDFYSGSSKIGTVTSSPFVFNWNSSVAGTHLLTLRALNQAGTSVTSAAVRINIASTNLLPDERPLILTANPGTLRNNFSGWVGMMLQVGSKPLIVSALGRWSSPGNQLAHAVKLVRALDKVDLPNGSVTLPPPNITNAFYYGALPQPVILEARGLYYVMTEETAEGDLWHDLDSVVTSRSAANVAGAVYYNTTFLWREIGIADRSYGPVDLRYRVESELQIISPANGASILSTRPRIEAEGTVGINKVEFYSGQNKLGEIVSGPYAFTWTNPPAGDHVLTVVGTTTGGARVSSPAINVAVAITNALATEKKFLRYTWLSSPRNDLTAFVGTKITIGPKPVVVTQLGRWVVTGNSGVHALKIVHAATGLDVVNGSVTVQTAGATSNAFVYAALANPVILRPGMSYYLVSDETRTLDVWGDSWSWTVPYTQSVARVDGPVYSTNSISWQFYAQPEQGYGPIDFKYLSSELRIASPLEGQSVVGPAAVQIQADVEPGMTAIDLFDGETKLGQISGPPYTFSWARPLPGRHILTLRGLRGDNSTATSAPVAITVAWTNATDVEKTFVRQIDFGRARPDYWYGHTSVGPGFIGVQVTVGPKPMIVTSLGRWIVSGNSNRHQVKLMTARDQLDVPGASVTIETAGAPTNAFKYQRLSKPVVLAAQTTYYLVSEEIRRWAPEAEAMLLTPNASAFQTEEEASITGEVISTGVLDWNFETDIPANDFKFLEQPGPPSITIYDPPGDIILFAGEADVLRASATGRVEQVTFFQQNTAVLDVTTPPYNYLVNNPVGEYAYTARALDVYGITRTSQVIRVHVVSNTAPQSFLESTLPGRIRNDFTGLLGMFFTVRDTPLVATALGRYGVISNRQDHLLQLWLVPKDGNLNNTTLVGQTTVSTTNAIPGEYRYQTLAKPLFLEPRRSYFLTSAETAGGDYWHETDSEVMPRPVGIVDGAVLNFDGVWTAVGQANRSYGPVNFLYAQGATPVSPSLTVVREPSEVRLLLTGEAGKSYVIEASVDLVSWVAVGTYPLTSSTLSFPAPQANAFSKRFYRVAP